MQKDVTSNSRGIAAENHSLRADNFTGYRRSAFRLSAVRVPGMSPEGHPHMQKNVKSDSRGITAGNHSHVGTEFTSLGRVKAQSLTAELRSREGDDR
jgi:hypothetical protein